VGGDVKPVSPSGSRVPKNTIIITKGVGPGLRPEETNNHLPTKPKSTFSYFNMNRKSEDGYKKGTISGAQLYTPLHPLYKALWAQPFFYLPFPPNPTRWSSLVR